MAAPRPCGELAFLTSILLPSVLGQGERKAVGSWGCFPCSEGADGCSPVLFRRSRTTSGHGWTMGRLLPSVNSPLCARSRSSKERPSAANLGGCLEILALL